MSDQVTVAVVGGVCLIIGGVVTAIIAPRLNWGIEKRRERLKRRRELVAEWRAGLAEAEEAGMPDGYNRTVWYQTLQPHMRGPGKTRRKVNRWAKRTKYWIKGKPMPKDPFLFGASEIIISPEGMRDGRADKISRHIERMVKKWRLE